MREIKFRAWDKEENEMRQVLVMAGDAYEISLGDVHGYRYWQGENTFELMQYTGLNDKNGKEIYEGDIIGMVSPVVEGSCWEVVWHNFSWQLLLHGREDIKNYYVKVSEHLKDDEVIGNIYENPELWDNSK